MGRILQDKVAVITGAGQGIGRAMAIRMAREGAKVVVNDFGSGPDGMGSSPVFAEEVVAEIRKENGGAIPNGDTVATEEGGRKIIDTAVENFGRIDILVNNAGIVIDKMIYNLTEQEWDLVVKVNLYGLFHCTRPASKIMKEQKWGRIINMSSGAGLGKTFGCANYAAAKEGVIGFTRAVARDMYKYNVTCNAIRPLAMTRHFDEERKQAWLRQGKKREVEEMENSKPEDVAAFAAYLAGEESAHVTGRTFFVGGGMISLYSEPERIAGVYRDNNWTKEKLRHMIRGLPSETRE
ncbi:MAG: SDR family oxidoreductase [Thermodesulfobacteriota bacterium]|nr:SDR family oxidoreductase [Thermodesulfobacteriota bacterium]